MHLNLVDDEAILASAGPLALIDAIEAAFRETAAVPARAHYDLPGEDRAKLLLMPAWRDRDAIGVKVASVVPRNAGAGIATIDGLYLLLDGETGRPRTILSAPALTSVRTAAVSGLASRLLARADATRLCLLGTGALAPHLVRAHSAVRPIEEVMIWGRDDRKAECLAETLAAGPARVTVVRSLEAAVAQADIVTCATASTAPLVRGAWIAPGTHVDLVGSFTPDMQEADITVFEKGRLVVDTAMAFEESGDLIAPARDGVIAIDTIPTLHDLVRDRLVQRRSEAEITIFKAVGTGLADLAAALWIEAGQGGRATRPAGSGSAEPVQSV